MNIEKLIADEHGSGAKEHDIKIIKVTPFEMINCDCLCDYDLDNPPVGDDDFDCAVECYKRNGHDAEYMYNSKIFHTCVPKGN